MLRFPKNNRQDARISSVGSSHEVEAEARNPGGVDNGR